MIARGSADVLCKLPSRHADGFDPEAICLGLTSALLGYQICMFRGRRALRDLQMQGPCAENGTMLCACVQRFAFGVPLFMVKLVICGK